MKHLLSARKNWVLWRHNKSLKSLPFRLGYPMVAVLIGGLFLSGCCLFGISVDEGDRVEGERYRVQVKSDFNDTIEVIYWDLEVKRDKNEIIRFLNCFDSIYDESVSTKSIHLNAFNFYDLDTFIVKDELVRVSVNYNGKSAHYTADPAFKVFVRESDFL